MWIFVLASLSCLFCLDQTAVAVQKHWILKAFFYSEISSRQLLLKPYLNVAIYFLLRQPKKAFPDMHSRTFTHTHTHTHTPHTNTRTRTRSKKASAPKTEKPTKDKKKKTKKKRRLSRSPPVDVTAAHRDQPDDASVSYPTSSRGRRVRSKHDKGPTSDYFQY